MPLSNPAEILLAHDRWATKQMLTACEGLSDEHFHRQFEMGVGSLHATLTHVIGAMRRWGDLLAGRELRPRLEQDEIRRTPAQLLSLHDGSADDFSRSAAGHPLDEKVSREFGGKIYSFTRGAVLTHVATHGMHHRAQCLNMLRHLGVRPLPKSSVMEWTFTEL
jgi:uncharacterized damage-inducible protein DinB